MCISRTIWDPQTSHEIGTMKIKDKINKTKARFKAYETGLF